MYRVIWNVRGRSGNEKLFETHSEAKSYFYYLVKAPWVSRAELIKV